MKVKHSIKCVRCPNVVDLHTDPESLTLFQEGKLSIQECFPELTPDQREMLLSGICPTCWNDLFGNLDDEYEEEDIVHNDLTVRDKNPTTFWQALKCCWNHRHITTLKREWKGRNIGYWAKWTITTDKFPVNYGRVETTIYFSPHRLTLPWTWFRWNSEHIASLMGREEIDGPGPGYGSTYHYEGWLGYHLAL
jgi:hypothetical protein